MKIRKFLLTLVLVLLALNCLTFVAVRIHRHRSGMDAANIEHASWKVRAGETVGNYLIAGNLNQARTAFKFLLPDLQGWINYVQFNMMGYDAKVTAQQITRDVKKLGLAEVNVYTISLGDHVGRYLEQYLGDSCGLKIIAINPCTDVNFVCQPLRTMLMIGAPIFEGVCHALGWLSAIPLIPTPEGKYSLILLADQYWSIAYDRPGHLIDHTIGVICSQPDPDKDSDGLLQNAAIRAYFWNRWDSREIFITTIETGHGTTINCGDQYLEGVRQIWQNWQRTGVAARVTTRARHRGL